MVTLKIALLPSSTAASAMTTLGASLSKIVTVPIPSGV